MKSILDTLPKKEYTKDKDAKSFAELKEHCNLGDKLLRQFIRERIADGAYKEMWRRTKTGCIRVYVLNTKKT